jgi:hypothetical protein
VYAPQRLCAASKDLIDELKLATSPDAPKAVNCHGAPPQGFQRTDRLEHGKLSRRKRQRGLCPQCEVAVATKRAMFSDGEPDVLHGNPPVWKKQALPTKTCRRNVVNRNVRRRQDVLCGLASEGAAR